jgi:hypothetical protein
MEPPPRWYTAPRHSFEPSVVLLMLYLLQAVAAAVTLPSAYWQYWGVTATVIIGVSCEVRTNC